MENYLYNVTVRGQNRYNIQVKISSVMLRKVIHHLRTIFYVSNQRMMVSEGPYNEAISNIGLIFGWNARVYNFFFFWGYERKQYPIYYDECYCICNIRFCKFINFKIAILSMCMK